MCYLSNSSNLSYSRFTFSPHPPSLSRSLWLKSPPTPLTPSPSRCSPSFRTPTRKSCSATAPIFPTKSHFLITSTLRLSQELVSLNFICMCVYLYVCLPFSLSLFFLSVHLYAFLSLPLFIKSCSEIAPTSPFEVTLSDNINFEIESRARES